MFQLKKTAILHMYNTFFAVIVQNLIQHKTSNTRFSGGCNIIYMAASSSGILIWVIDPGHS